jgi:GNAT superfamily N-acetyltransferase
LFDQSGAGFVPSSISKKNVGKINRYVYTGKKTKNLVLINNLTEGENKKLKGQVHIRSYRKEDINYIIDRHRGKGLGHRLMKTVMDFCTGKGYRHIFLWTVDTLEAARHLYEVYGFTLTETKENSTWTDDIIKEERWDLSL